MAINYTYPVKSAPTVSDNVLIIDNEDTTNPRSTKTATIQSIVNLASGGGGGGATWGSITGTLSTQTDLQSALDAKQSTLTLTTTGTSGAATLVGANLNIPQYSGGGGVSSVTGTAPVVSSGGTTPDISMAAATTLEGGYLTRIDWNAFNNKLTSVSGDLTPVLSGNLDVNTNSIVSNGGLDIKITPDGGGDVIIDGIKYPQTDGAAGQVIQTNGAGQLLFATVSGSGTVTEVTANAPLSVISGASTPDLTIAQSTTSTDGYLSSTDWNTFNNKLSSVSGDALPVLSGNLDVNGNSIVSAGNGDISITPAGTGSVILDGISYPKIDGTIDQVLKTDGAGQLSFTTVGGGGSGDVVGPSSATDNAIARFDTTTGKLIQNSLATIDDTGNITAPDFIGDLNGAVRFTGKAIGTDIDKGEVVYISGISGNTPEIELAQSDSFTTMTAFGIAIDDIPQNNTGEIASFGSVKGLDVGNFGETSITFSIGDTVYVSSTEAGKLTNVPPTSEANLIQNIGKIERATPTTNMTIKVGGAGRANATPNLDSAKMFLGSSANQAVSVAMSGDVTISNTGVTTVGVTATEVPYGNVSGALTSEAAFTYDDTQNKLRADQIDSNLSTAKQFTTGTSSITSSGGAATWDAAQGAYGEFLLTENTTLAITNLPVGTPAVLKVTQDGASSFNITAYTVGGGAVKFPGGTVPTITAAVNSVDIISFIADATDIYASANQDFK